MTLTPKTGNKMNEQGKGVVIASFERGQFVSILEPTATEKEINDYLDHAFSRGYTPVWLMLQDENLIEFKPQAHTGG